MKGLFDIKIPMGMIVLFMVLIVVVTFGFVYIGTFFNALGSRFPEFMGSGNWMIVLAVLIIIVVLITYIEMLKKKSYFK